MKMSKEYNKSQIKELIESHKDWKFMYIGADIDSYSEGRSIGIDDSFIANYEKSEKGVTKLFSALSSASECYYESNELKKSWKNELE